MPKITLPEGCHGLDFADGSKVSGKQGSAVEITQEQAKQIDGNWHQRAGILNSSQRLSFGTPNGKRCIPCKRLWNSWTDVCHKCGEPTTPESDGS